MPFVIKLDRSFLFEYEKEWFHLINHVSVSYAKTNTYLACNLR